jgi:predicted nicotinamide N-methyase
MSDKWKLLRNYLRKDEHQEKAGKRTSFDLFPKGLPVKLASIATPTFSATQHVSEFAGFLNTGVAVACWETERVLAYYLQSVNVDGLRVLELGSGSVGLAGLILAATQTPRLVVLTDGSSQSKLLGNPQCITNIEEIIAINSFNCPVLASQLLWGSEDKVEEQSDMIIVSDCLYETDYHESLLNTLKAHLAPEGQVLMV